jgi:hypothetical protein
MPAGFSFDLPPETSDSTRAAAAETSAPDGLSFDMGAASPQPAPEAPTPFETQKPLLNKSTFGEAKAPVAPFAPPAMAHTNGQSSGHTNNQSLGPAIAQTTATPPPPPPKRSAEVETPAQMPPRPFPKRDPGIPQAPADAGPIELTHVGPPVPRMPAGQSTGLLFDTCVNYEQVTETAFRLASPPFQRAMMLVFQGGFLKPWKWTQEFHPRKEKPDPVDLESPSVFRIVYNTLLPYHGRIVPNDINSRFFDQVDGGRIPSHLTIVPILIDGHVAAMLLAATDADINYRSSLALMERIAEQMGEALKRIRTEKPKAA